MSSAKIEHVDGLPQPQRNWAILTIALGLVMAVMDGAIANVALPTIARDLDASPAFSIWIVNGYQLAITISLLPLASLGEITGYRRVYLAGLLLFTLASLFCALSHTLPLLTIARIVQGFGAAGIMSVNMALVRYIYPRDLLGRGIGINAMVVAVSAAVGPTVAAAILAVGTWPYLFAVNIPLGIVALAVGWRCLPHILPAIHAFDWQSAALSAVTFGLGIVAIDSAGHDEASPSACRNSASLPSPAFCWYFGRPKWLRHCCRWTCCAFLFSRCRSPPRLPPSAPRCWPSWRCRFIWRAGSDIRRCRSDF